MSRVSPCIVVINDDRAIVTFLQEALEDEGYTTRGAFIGSTAYPLIRETSPALVVLDMQMETRDAGLHVVRALRRDPATSAIPVIICSADSFFLRTHAAELQQAGCYTLEKPFALDALLNLVAALI